MTVEFNFSSVKTNPEAETEEHVKVLILGSGPAGLSAALYAARAELQPVVLTGMSLGGQAANTFTIENYPGFPEGVGGAELGELFQKQAERFGARVEFETANAVDLIQRPFRITGDNKVYLADSLIIATGASPTLLGIPGEKELTGKGVSYCATCDGFFFRDQEILVVGGGDSAMEEASFLSRFASKVTIVHRRDELRASKIMQERARANDKIRFAWNSVVTDVVGDGSVEGVVLRDLVTNEERTLAVTGLFVAIGHKPNTDLFAGQLDRKDNGYLVTEPGTTRTNVPGVFACGDVQDDVYRQAITAAGTGCMSAIDAERFLEAHGE